jgi:hypothetical protein
MDSEYNCSVEFDPALKKKKETETEREGGCSMNPIGVAQG